MTLIVSAKGLILADSLRRTPEADLFKTGKITPYERPRHIRSRRLGITDTYFGFAGSGDDQIVEYAGATTFGVFDIWEDRYRVIDEMRCLTEHSSFLIMFFGLKGTMAALVNSGLIDLEYYPHSQYSTVMTGSGADAYHRVVKEHQGRICPVRAAFAAFAMEPSCGGAVEVWRAPLSVKEGLKKLVVIPAAPLPKCFTIASQPRKLMYAQEHIPWLQQNIPDLEKPSPKPSKTKTARKRLLLPGFRTLKWGKPSLESFFHRLKVSPPSPSSPA
jgi:hypothetical protein